MTCELPDHHPLVLYSRGEISRQVAIRVLKIRDYAELLVYLSDAGLPMPMSPESEIEEQAATMAMLFRMT